MKVRGYISQKEVAGVIAQDKVTGRISQHGVISDLIQKIVCGTIRQLGLCSCVEESGTDNVVPVLLSAVVEDATPNIITLTYDLPLDSSIIPDIAQFSPTENFTESIAISGSTVILTCTMSFNAGDVIHLTYWAFDEMVRLKGLNGVNVEQFLYQNVTNNIEAI